MNAFFFIIPIAFVLAVSKLIIPPYVPAPRVVATTPAQMSPFELRQRLRAQREKDAMREESVTAGSSEE